VVPSDSHSLAKLAVPVASAELSDVMAFAVKTPPEAEAKAVDPMVNVANRVLPESAVSAFVGLEPS
jgi:hypothetical protein